MDSCVSRDLAEIRYRHIFDATSNAIAVYRAERGGEDFVFVDFNRAGEEIEQVRRDDVVGRSVLAVFPGVREFGLFEVLQRVWRTGKQEDLPVKLYHDRRISGYRDNRVYRLPDGEVVVIYSDRTREMQREEELRLAKEQAEAASRAKSAFLANMSHDIKSPIAGIISMAEMLGESELDPRQRRSLDAIRRAGESLLHLVGDILDLSRIEAGRLSLVVRPFDPASLAEETGRLFGPQFARKGLKLDVCTAPGLPAGLLGDRFRILQVVHNLVGNAGKFTRQGWVRVTVGGEAAGSAFRLEIAVRDTGIGIPPDRLGSLFRAYEQAHEESSSLERGAGLGLSIVKQLVEAMGGTVSVESRLGLGSTFTVELPLPVAG